MWWSTKTTLLKAMVSYSYHCGDDDDNVSSKGGLRRRAVVECGTGLGGT